MDVVPPHDREATAHIADDGAGVSVTQRDRAGCHPELQTCGSAARVVSLREDSCAGAVESLEPDPGDYEAATGPRNHRRELLVARRDRVHLELAAQRYSGSVIA